VLSGSKFGSYLIGKHLINGLFLQDPLSALGMNTIIQKGSNDLTIFCRLREAPPSTRVESFFDFFWGLGCERFAKNVALWSQ